MIGRRVLSGFFSRFAAASLSPSWTPGRRHTATVLDGRSVAEKLKKEVAMEVAMMKAAIGKIPRLAVVLVGTRRESELYVYNKILACAETGIATSCTKLPENASEEDVVRVVQSYNEDPSVHGILVQLPLPQHLKEERILSTLSIEKDVDGCHPLNIGNLSLQGRRPLFVPCTAKACIELLLDTGISLCGKTAVVIGCSNIVGLPVALLLQRHNATVTAVHAFTAKPEEYTRAADIVISAAGSPNLVRGHWLKPNAVVLDVGINHVQSPSSRDIHLIGDVCFEEACKVASAVSPVPGGIGPVTVAMLLQNTMEAAVSMHGVLDLQT